MQTTSDIVRGILHQVQEEGDQALCRLARQFDGVTLRPQELQVPKDDLERARKQVSQSFIKTLKECSVQIEAFAKAEKKRLTTSWSERQGSARIGQLIRPVDSAGLYIPGGRFPYPSTVLMSAIPARVAGVKRLVMATPPRNLTPEVLAAADWAGVDAVYRLGGAGAIAAMAFGTAQVQKVDFIVGPGNQFVTEAKRQVFGVVGIDSLAGPSEVVIIADKSSPVDFILVDLHAQAEHDPEAKAILLSNDDVLLGKVQGRLDRAIASRVRLQRVATLNAAFEEANRIAPEHLEVLIKNADRYLSKIHHAGAIFLGPMTPAALGDYSAGPSHVLPTHGAARFSSGLSVATFLKRSSVMSFNAVSSERSRWEAALTMAETEGMEYHARSLRARMSR
jgi:histidinol dehydrogenase